jgi:putative membrane protein
MHPTTTEPIDDAPRIGLPVPGTAPPEPPPPPAPVAEEADLRPGETGLGRPPQTPALIAPLTDQDRAALQAEADRQAALELAEAEELLASRPTLFGLPAIVAHPLTAAALLVITCVLALFVFSQATSTLAHLATLPEHFRYPGWAALAILSLAVLYAALRLAVFYFRLRRNQQIRLRGLEQLARRTRLRWLARAKTLEARQQIEAYVRTFPIDTDRDRRALARLGLTEERLGRLRVAREELLNPDRLATSDQWFERFRLAFQQPLDEVAAERVSYWAKRTAVVTAVSPNSLVDTSASLYFSFTMLADLCRIYNLRAGRMGTAVLLVRVFFNAYLAGQVNEMQGVTEHAIEGLFSPTGPLYELTAAKVVGKVGASAASGALNYFLLVRLGRYGSRLLRPVSAE